MHYHQPTGPATDIPSPDPRTAPPSRPTVADVRQLDGAVDYAARVCAATVSEFLAAPTDCDALPLRPPGIEVAVEFFVPPGLGAVRFAGELDRELVRRSVEYAALRRAGHAPPLRVTVLPPGAFHQWRAAWNVDRAAQHARRWAGDRQLIDGVLRQASTGWREIFPTG